MNTWIRKVGMGALALTLAGVLGGCNNGSGGGLIRLFFGINGSGSCTSVIVDVNLEDAGADIARDNLGNVQCVLDAALDASGCGITFQELSNGDLRTVISGCTIPAVTNLFSCLFEDVDISELQDTASAACNCTTQNCDGTPPVCISTEPNPTSCEDCDNNQDDDGNGLVDCEDPNCENSPACNGTTTTSTTSTTNTLETTTTTNTTSTTVSTTTSTTEELFNCTLIFRLTDDVTLGALQWDTDYSNAPGGFLGTAGNVECASLVQDTVEAFNDVEASELLHSGLISTDGFTGPLNVAECTFRANITPVKSDFAITVIEAAEPDLDPVVPLPGVVIQSIDCETPPTTTTLPGQTTTTEPGQTTTTTEAGPTTTTLPGGPQNYIITYKLTADNAPALVGVGALQWKTDYTTATGGIQGSAGTAACTSPVVGALFAKNDVDATKMLTLGLISSDGFGFPGDLPQTIATCTFNGNLSDPPTPGDFPFTIEDKTDVNGDPITATITVTVTQAP